MPSLFACGGIWIGENRGRKSFDRILLSRQHNSGNLNRRCCGVTVLILSGTVSGRVLVLSCTGPGGGEVRMD